MIVSLDCLGILKPRGYFGGHFECALSLPECEKLGAVGRSDLPKGTQRVGNRAV
jgi:hypothetical protein